MRSKDPFRMLNLLDPHISLKPQGLFRGEKIIDLLYDRMNVSRFEELEIPFKTIATDFWRSEPVVFDSGELLPALRATMALPYIFTPVVNDDHVLVDGGLVNNVPFDLLSPKCDYRIAVDVMGSTSTPKDKTPSFIEAIFHTYQVMMNATTQAKRACHPVDIYLQPPVVDIDILDFHKAWEIYEQGRRAKDDFKRRLEKMISGGKSRLNWLGKK